jgi:hypothetical protein
VIIPFRICDLKIIDDVKPVEQSDGTWFDKVVGCLITPNDLDRGRWYCLCNDTDDGMHVKFTPGEISPADFYIDQGATVAIYVSGEKIIMDGDYNPKWHEYTIWRVMPDGEVLCSGDSGPGMKVQDPPPG